jgi:integrase/recombinase XerD
MTPIGPHLTVFLREYLPSQREMSVQTSDTYAYAFQLLVCFAADRLKTTPAGLSIEQLDATLVLAFLEHLEQKRGNCARTRNCRSRRKTGPFWRGKTDQRVGYAPACGRERISGRDGR